MRYICSVCGYIYDEAREKQAFSELPDSWKCPVCKAAKGAFAPEEKANPPKAAVAPAPAAIPAAPKGEVLEQLSIGALSALCSNLARGCEKQYKEEEAALFRTLADYFAAVTPTAPQKDIDGLAALLQNDLEQGYPAVKAAADATGDRGTKRICTWGEKVTNMLNSLISQYRQEGEALLAETEVWVCTVCGFIYIGANPPQLCPVCKVPAWKFDKIEGREQA